MDRRHTAVLILCVLMTSLSRIQLSSVVIVKAPSGYLVHNLNTRINYTTIQSAINASETINGHTIFVESGTFYENVFINKSIMLVGENKETTIIDGSGINDVVTLAASNVTITGFTIMNGWDNRIGYEGIKLMYVNNCNITRNIIKNNNIAVSLLDYSSKNTIQGNIMKNNSRSGIEFWISCNNNTISDNNITTCGVCLSLGNVCDNNTVVGNNLRDNGFGITLYNSENSRICENDVQNNTYDGIELEFCKNIVMSYNNVTKNELGICLIDCSNITMRNNTMLSNKYNFEVDGRTPSEYMNDVDMSNSVNEKPIVYLTNIQNITIEPSVYPDIGCLIVANSTKVIIRNMEMKDNYEGVALPFTSDCLVQNLTVADNHYGIYLRHSVNNTVTLNNMVNNAVGLKLYISSDRNNISRNYISGNSIGIYVGYSSDNCFFFNNLMDNLAHVHNEDSNYPNVWDNGYPFGGNYWGDYAETDANHDGIGDYPYVADANNTDNYPLMGMLHRYCVTSECYVDVISNSTINSFEFLESNNTIIMYASNATTNQTFGFCRILIPHTLMTTPCVTVNGTEPYFANNTLCDNGTHRWIYISYQHSTLKIVIVYEYSSLFVLILFMTATAFLTIAYKRKIGATKKLT